MTNSGPRSPASILKAIAIFLAILLSQITFAADRTIVIYSNGPQFNLGKTQSMWDYVVSKCIQGTLIKLNHFGEVEGGIADSWTISKDKKEITFHIKSIPISKNKILTGKDVKLSLIRDLKSGSDIAIQLRPIIKKIIDSDRIVKIMLDQAYGPLLKSLASVDLSIDPDTPHSSIHRVGLGPYRVKSYNKTSQILWLTPRSSQNPNLKIIYTKDLKKIETLSGQKNIDAILGLPNRIFSEFPTPSNMKRKYLNNLAFTSLLVNPDRPIGKLEYLRKAISVAVQTAAKKYSANTHDPQFSPLTCLLPDGVLGKYCQSQKFSLSTQVPANGYKVKIGYPDKWWPAAFKTYLIHELEASGIPFTIVPIRSGKHFDFKSVDIIPSDYILPNADPDLAIPAFDISAFGLTPPKGFDELKKTSAKLNAIDGIKRLKAYSTAFRKLENDGWAIPLFSQKIAVFVSSRMSLGEATYQFESLLCR